MNHPTSNYKRRFNVVDILILLALLAIGAFAANYIANDMFAQEHRQVEYVLRLTGVSEQDLNRLSPDKVLAADSAGTTWGKIREISTTETKKAVFNQDTGRYVYAVIPGKYNVYLRVGAVCTYKDHQYFIGSYRVSAGTCPEILLPFSFESAEIVSVKTIQVSPVTAENEPTLAAEASDSEISVK